MTIVIKKFAKEKAKNGLETVIGMGVDYKPGEYEAEQAEKRRIEEERIRRDEEERRRQATVAAEVANNICNKPLINNGESKQIYGSWIERARPIHIHP